MQLSICLLYRWQIVVFKFQVLNAVSQLLDNRQKGLPIGHIDTVEAKIQSIQVQSSLWLRQLVRNMPHVCECQVVVCQVPYNACGPNFFGEAVNSSRTTFSAREAPSNESKTGGVFVQRHGKVVWYEQELVCFGVRKKPARPQAFTSFQRCSIQES